MTKEQKQEGKKCSNCFQIKTYSEFYTRKYGDGYQSRCKSCNAEVVYGYNQRKKLKLKEMYDQR